MNKVEARQVKRPGNRPALSEVHRAAVLFSSRSINSVLSLLFSLIAGKILSVEDHGLFGQSMARVVVVQAMTEVGLQFSLVRFMAPAIKRGDDGEISALLRASLHLKTLAILIVAFFTFFILFWVLLLPGHLAGQWIQYIIPTLRSEGLTIFWMIFLGGVGMSVLSYLDAVLVSHEYFYRLSLWIPSLGILRLALLSLFYFVEKGGVRAEHVVYAFSMGPFLAIGVYFLVFPASFFFRKYDESAWQPWVGKLFRFNVWIMAASFMSIVSDWMEILMIGDSRSSGLYNAARLPMQGFAILLATMQSLLLPKFAGLETSREFAAMFKKVYRLLVPGAILMIPGFWIFSWFIPAWYGPLYQPSVTVFYILYPNFLLRIFFFPLGTALFALDQPRLIAYESGLRMSAGIALNLLLIPLYGILGAAWASLLAQFAGWSFLLFFYGFYFRKDRFPFDKK